MGEARCFKLDMEIDYVEYWHMHDRLPEMMRVQVVISLKFGKQVIISWQ